MHCKTKFKISEGKHHLLHSSQVPATKYPHIPAVENQGSCCNSLQQKLPPSLRVLPKNDSLRGFLLRLKWVTHCSNVVFSCRSYENASEKALTLKCSSDFHSMFQNYLMGKDSLLKNNSGING